MSRAGGNTAPALDASKSPTLDFVVEDWGLPNSTSGRLVSNLVDLTSAAGGLDNVTDPDPGAVTGVAVIATDTSNGAWWYTTDGGTTWNPFGTQVDALNARLLAADSVTRIYFQPNANYFGTIAPAIVFRAWDRSQFANGSVADASSGGGSLPFSVESDGAYLDVLSVPDYPTIAAPANLSVAEESELAITTVSVDDVDSSTLSVELDSGWSGNTLTLGTTAGLSFSVGDGTADESMTFGGSIASINAALATLVFRPRPDLHGMITLYVEASDETSFPRWRVIDINVSPVADTVPDIVTTAEDTPITFDALANDTFEDPAALIVSISSSVGGTFTAFRSNVTYTPSPNLNGNSAGAVAYRVYAGERYESGTVTVNVTPVNDAPTSTAPLSISLLEDGYTTFAATVSDLDGDALTVALSTSSATLTLADSAGLSFVVGDGTDDAAMSFSGAASAINNALAAVRFTPAPDFVGNASLVFDVADGPSPTVPISKTIVATVAGVADIAADSIATNEDLAVTFNALTGAGGGSADDFENPAAQVGGVSTPVHGSATFVPNGELTYTPAPDYAGPDSFTYSVTSGGATESANVTVTVNAINDAPRAGNVSAAESYFEDTPLDLADIVVSDIDNASVIVTLTLSIPAAGRLTTGTSGAVTSTYASGSGTWTAQGAIPDVNVLLAGVAFVPTVNSSANLTIATSVSDGVAPPVTGSKSLTGVAVNDAPTLDPIVSPVAAVGASSRTVELSGISAVEAGQSLALFASSSDTALVPIPHVVYTSPNSTGSLHLVTNAAPAGGTATITVTVLDDGGTANGGVDASAQTFVVTVDTDVVYADGYE